MKENQPGLMRRRGFLGSVLAAGIAPMFIPARLLGAEAPSKILRIGCIGTGRMGSGNMLTAVGLGKKHGSRIVAVCDVNRQRAVVARDMALKASRELHGDSTPEIRIHHDHHELLAREDIDGVIICTPDFWHAFIALDAARAGKGIYLEKPLTYTIPEGRALVKAVRKHGVVLQTGSQQRSSTHFHRVCWLVRNGRIGTIREITISNPLDQGTSNATPMPVPECLDYQRWMGPTTDEPYTEDRVHPMGADSIGKRPGWMQIQKYSHGMVSNWGAHSYDIAQWGLGTDFDSGPVEISAKGEFPDRGLFDVHTSYSGVARYASGIVLKSGTGADGEVLFTGSDGWLKVSRGKFEASNPDLLRERPEGGIELATSDSHIGNFIDCLRSGKDPVAPVEVGHRSNTVCVLHQIAMITGRKIKWDPATEQISDDPDAEKRLTREYRKGFTSQREVWISNWTAKNHDSTQLKLPPPFPHKTTGLDGAAIGLPTIIPARVLGADAPSKKINILQIGCGRIGRDMDMPGILRQEDARLVALCDLDSLRLADGKEIVEGHYGKKNLDLNVATYGDYREAFQHKAIDAVSISTPDHWHAEPVIATALLGKDIYVQKPLTMTIAEGRAVSDIVRKKGCMFQIGNQQCSGSQFRIACEMVRSGRSGKLQTVRIGLPRDPAGGSTEEIPVLPILTTTCGSAARRRYPTPSTASTRRVPRSRSATPSARAGCASRITASA